MKKVVSLPEQTFRILKIGTCPSLSGRSELVYHLGCNAESEATFKLVQNSGNGQFNADWLSLESIRKQLDQHPADKPMTSRVLHPLFRGKSSNSPSFLFAVLLAEGLVKPTGEKDGGYVLGDVEAFTTAVTTLIAADTNLAADTSPEPLAKAISRKRKAG